MYTRQYPNDRYGRGVRVPRNYGGSVFSEPSPKNSSDSTYTASDPNPPSQLYEEPTEEKTAETASVSSSPLNGLLGNLGGEELLLLGLILLLATGEQKDDLWVLLLLLLFIR